MRLWERRQTVVQARFCVLALKGQLARLLFSQYLTRAKKKESDTKFISTFVHPHHFQTEPHK